MLLAELAVIFSCWTVACWPFSAAVESSVQQPPFSASLLYIYAADSVEWPSLTGRQLRANDTLLIRPGVAYKIWCEVLPEGWPRIRSNVPGAIAYHPLPLNTMAHVELQRDLIGTLKFMEAASKPAKLWCDYSQGNKKMRTEVLLKPLISANTTCDYFSANGLAAEGSLVNFTCTSTSGYPPPEHKCQVVKQGSGIRSEAQVVSVIRVGADTVVTMFSMPVSKDNQNASIQCSVEQRVAYRGFSETYAQKVRPTGLAGFSFASESVKHCERILKGDFSVTIQCRSEGGLPQTEHRCWKTGRVNKSDAAPLLAKVQGASYITEMTLNNTWADQGGSVSCVLQQGPFYAKRFSLHIPGFQQSVKSCHFSQLKDGGLQAKCFTGIGLPPAQHGCNVQSNATAAALRPNNTVRLNGTQTTSYRVPVDALPPGSSVVCTLRQEGFEPAVFVHQVPKFTESRKVCHFINSSWEVRATCEFSSGNPRTRSDCQLLVANSSVRLHLEIDKESPNAASQLFSNSYSVRLPGPDVSHAGGSIVCRVHQDALFVRTFVYHIAEYKPNATREDQKLGVSKQTVLSLSLALVVALLLVLLMSLPIHALRRCLGRKRKGAGSAPEAPYMNEGEGLYATLVQPERSGPKPPMRLDATQTPDFDLYEIFNNRRGGYSRRDGMPDIDQTSMFECGYAANLPNASKRKSVLADALIRCQAELDRREYRFSV